MVAIAIVIFLIIVAVAYGVVFDIYSSQVKKKSPNAHPMFHKLGARLVISLGSGLVAVMLMKLAEENFPAADDPVFSQSSSFNLSGDHIGYAPQTICSSDADSGLRCRTEEAKFERTITLNIEFPETVQVDSDFSIHVSAFTNGILFRKGVHSAALYSPRHVQMRTTRECPSTILSENSVMPACVDLHTESDRFDLIWDLTPTRTGSSRFVIKADLDQYDESNRIYIPISFEKLFFGRKDYSFILEGGRVLAGGVIIDHENREVRFLIEILTTLGVRQSTYDRLKAVAGVLALFGTLFGAGYIRNLVSGKTKKAPSKSG